MKNIIIVGKGSREHVIREKLSHHQVEMISNINEINKRKNIDLVVIGPEKDLVEGYVDKSNFLVFGPSKEASHIEGSKIFSKIFMLKNNIPTSEYFIPKSKEDLISFFSLPKSRDNLLNSPTRYVIKKDGLCGGKGVFLPDNLKEVNEISKELDDKFLVEEKLYGTEVSVMGFCNGKDIVLFPQICDYKRLSEDYNSPNTGGMGAIGPVNILSSSEIEEVKNHMLKVVKELKFKGVLYAGIMKTEEGVFFLEFNCRFGDPETQVGLNLLDSDLYQIMIDCILGNNLDYIKWNNKFCGCVVLADSDYPYKKLQNPVSISYGNLDNTVKIYLANPVIEENIFKTNGGRISSIVSVSDSLNESLENIYNNITKVNYDRKYFRRDIGLDYLLRQRKNIRNLKLGIVSSSRGTSIKKLLEESKDLNVTVEVIISNKKSEILDKAMEYNIPNIYLPNTKDKKLYYNKLSNLLESFDLDFIFAVGYSNIFPDFFCQKFNGKLLNIHPSLLPEYSGLFDEDIHKIVIKDKNKYSGCTLHYISTIIDGGRIALQKQYKLKERENTQTLKEEIQKLESDTIIDFIKIHQSLPINYKNSGVNIKKGDEFVNKIKDEFIGSFCGIYKIGDKYFGSSTDGVGTKLELANSNDMLENIGFDLVGMCVNDLIVRGIKPKFFLDYIAMDKINNDKLLIIINSIKEACKETGCDLVGGETAEMPGVYRSECLDLAGFSVGTLEGELYPKIDKIKAGMKIYGLPSNGIHSNGFSLVRKLLKYEDYDINILLKPTKIYTECFQIMEKYKDSLLGMAHITGGGLIDNIKRILPEHLDLNINIDIKDEFKWIMDKSDLNYNEMLKTFNCGFGIALIFDDNRKPTEFEEIGKVVKN